MKKLDIVAIGCLYLMIFSIFYSLFLLSVSSLGFSAIALFKYWKEKPNFDKDSFRPYLALTAIFMVTVFSGVNSEDVMHWIRHLRLKLPFLFIPIAFFLQRRLVAKEFLRLSGAFFLLSIISTIPVLAQFSDIDSMLLVIKKGQAVETPVDHIKYSLYIAFSIFIAWFLYREKEFLKTKWKNPLLVIGGIYLFVFLHLLAVRSGLAVFYMAGFFILLRFAIIDKKPILFVPILLLMITPFIAYKTVPTLNKKMEYMIYDYKMYLEGKGNNLSDSERLYSYQAGLNIFVQSPVLGSGIGDLKAECRKQYEKLFGVELNKYPHNQFLFILAGSGMTGLILFLIGMCYPIFYFRKKQDSYFFAIWLVVMISFLVENTLERSYSISFFLLFLLGGMCRMQESAYNDEIVSNPQSR